MSGISADMFTTHERKRIATRTPHYLTPTELARIESCDGYSVASAIRGLLDHIAWLNRQRLTLIPLPHEMNESD